MRALVLGYGFQVAVALVGLVLAPFLLGRLGAHDYGLWLVVAQVLGLLGLLDLGVNAILGREVAAASGGAEPSHGGRRGGSLRDLARLAPDTGRGGRRGGGVGARSRGAGRSWPLRSA